MKELENVMSQLERETKKKEQAENKIKLLKQKKSKLKGNAETKNITIFSEITPDIYANIDESMMMRVFINLLSNAVTYGKTNGKIYVDLDVQEKTIVIKIADDGIGISDEHIDKIWTRFYQVDPSRNSEGTGLGLSMVKWIVEAHSGTISVVSKLGEGTIFTIKIPLKIHLL